MKSNTEQLKIAKEYLGESCPRCCSMRNNCCCYFVCKIFSEADNASLFYNGFKVTYCPNAIKWCKNMLTQIPLYLAMPSDVIFFDWELNGTPNHIGFVDHRIDDTQIATLEGNTTSRYVVAQRVRTAKYIQGIFRPHFPATYNINKPLVIDGQFNYSSIAMLQKALDIKVDGILGKDTVKALQKRVGVSQDGSWGVNTSKAVQTFLKKQGFYTGAVDGHVYEGTVKALQAWCNKYGYKGATPKPTPQPTPKPTDDGKLDIDGSIGKKTILRMQEFFGTLKDGIVSGQKESLYKYYGSFEKDVVRFDGGGSALVMKLQKWLGVEEDGIIGEATVKAWQKKIGVSVDGSFGTNSAKMWQRYLNEHDKPVYPTPKPTPKTLGDKVADEALKWIGKCPYVSGGTNIHKGVDCTGFVQEMYRLCGKKLSNKLSSWGRSIGKDISKAKRGDVLTYKDGTGIHHAIYVGDGMVVHASNKKDGIKKSKWNSMSRPLVGIRRPWK